MNLLRNKYYLRVRTLFKDANGKPFEMTPGQCEVFKIIFEEGIKRGVIRTTTQYGKSEVASMAIIMIMLERAEKILIVAPSTKQAEIIMGNVIKHFFDHPYLTAMIDYQGKLEQLKQERSRRKIVTKNGGEVMILTAEASTVAKEARSLMGFGAKVVIVDESSLIPDLIFFKILRMVGGYQGGKLIQLGNPFERNHFWKAFQRDYYTKLVITYKQALAEGRLTPEYIAEVREDMDEISFKIFYECEFPDGGDNVVIPMDWLLKAVDNTKAIVTKEDILQGGLDIARFGHDSTVLITRRGYRLEHIDSISQQDTMAVVGWASNIFDEQEIDTLAIDIVGLGAGVYDRMDELGYDVVGINVGESPTDDEAKQQFFNLRAQVYWNLRNVFKLDSNGNSHARIPNDKQLIEDLASTTYRWSSEKKRRIDSKDDIKKILGRSPDKGDACGLAFFDLTERDPQLMIV